MFNRGNALVNLERYRDALTSYKKSLEINPNNHLARQQVEDLEGLLSKADRLAMIY